ncbi:APC amino acid permease [Coprinopsis sp. MPI-PUGE-AT-0042]|nr:APC amino acid permease [Coprinopsis sp. MPI-PUGE-AT-0042]
MSQAFEDRAQAIHRADAELLASLGYKQEFKRAFKPLEVFGIAFSIIGLLPSIASVLFYSLPNGGGPAMVWGWLVASVFITCVGMAMGELASAAPTSGGLYFWTYALSSPRWRNLLCWVVGYANTVGNISAVASIDFGCAIQVMAAASIGTNGAFVPTAAQTFGVYAAIVLGNILVCSFGTVPSSRLQAVYIVLNVLLCLAVIVALPIATPAEYRNTAKFALGDIFNGTQRIPTGFAFIYSFLSPLWTICSFDSAVHISEEASNAATAVPWGIVGAIAISGLSIWLAFCMGTDIQALLDSDIGQPMAAIFFNSFGKKPTRFILLSASRQSYAFARDGALPFSSWIYTMTGFAYQRRNQQRLCSLRCWALRRLLVPIVARYFGPNDFKPGPFNLGKFSPYCAAISVLFMWFMLVIFLFPGAPTVPTAGDMNFTVVVLGGVLFLSLIYYFLPVYGGRHWFTGPVRTVETHSHSDGSSDSIGDTKQSMTETKVDTDA